MIWHVRVEGPLINDHDIAVPFSKHSRVLALELDKTRSGAKGSLRQGLRACFPPSTGSCWSLPGWRQVLLSHRYG
jgi:hypothetical protein